MEVINQWLGFNITLYKAHFGVLLWKRVMETSSVSVCCNLLSVYSLKHSDKHAVVYGSICLMETHINALLPYIKIETRVVRRPIFLTPVPEHFAAFQS